MNSGVCTARLSANRLHLQQGPIDLVIRAEGDPTAIDTAYANAEQRFQSVLFELVSELPLLRSQTTLSSKPGLSVALRMWEATALFPEYFITPMAAVAGSVADEILKVMLNDCNGLKKVFVNNGGDIALWKDVGEKFRIEVVPQPVRKHFSERSPFTVNIGNNTHVGGVATSGRHGRSFSLGIADSVTVLAGNAAIADAAATLIASAVRVESEKIKTQPACEIDPDSDLGQLQVCTDVGMLEEEEFRGALNNGRQVAAEFIENGVITSAFLFLQNHYICIPDNTDIISMPTSQSGSLQLQCA
ncbi:MAG: UPF0280 family protein [Gammaproteobacteria bacterium]|nr:UPF0280 family protein [Gammaproteobacteria bacterium]